MSVATVKSTAITNRDATPQVHNGSYLQGGIVRQWVAEVSVTTADTSTSTYVLGTVPSNARISSIQLWSDDMGTATTIDFGLWDTTANGSASVSPTLFASGYDVHSGAVSGTDIMFSNLSTANLEKRVWELLGLSADSQKDYDLVARLAVTADVGGKLGVRCAYVV